MVSGRSRSAVSGSFAGAQKSWPAGAGRFPRLVRERGGVSTPKSRARRHHETHSHHRRSRQNWERAAVFRSSRRSLRTCASTGFLLGAEGDSHGHGPPRWAGGTYTPSLPALAPHSATRAAVRRNAAAASAEAGGGTDGATCGSRADATGRSRAGAVAAGCRPPRVRCQYRLWHHRTDGTGASALQEGHLRGLPRSRRSTRAKLSNWQRRKQRRIVRSESR